MRFPTHEVRQMKLNCAVTTQRHSLLLIMVVLSRFWCLRLRIKIIYCRPCVEGRAKVRGLLNFIIFLRVHSSDITLSYPDYLKQDADNLGAEKKRALLSFLLFLKAQASDITLTYPVSASVHTNTTFQHRSFIYLLSYHMLLSFHSTIFR
jgi:hypothetical protein